MILDWVPSHFPADAFALGRFDGTHLFEHADPRLGFHPDWKSLIFNYGRHEVRSFLASSAEHWLSTYHADGLRVDAVASMLYLDYSRRPGEWLPNAHGRPREPRGDRVPPPAEHRHLRRPPRRAGHRRGVHGLPRRLAARSTAAGSASASSGTWAGCTTRCDYLARDPIYRRHHHGELTFRSVYAFSENFMLPLSHDEVVYGKGSLLDKDARRRLAALRQSSAALRLPVRPAGQEVALHGRRVRPAARVGSRVRRSTGHLLESIRPTPGIQRWVGRPQPALPRQVRPSTNSTPTRAGSPGPSPTRPTPACSAFLRFSRDGSPVLAMCNFTPVPRHNVLAGVPVAATGRELLNSDAVEYGGSGVGNMGGVEAQPVPATACRARSP